jgi:hypothetical protein
MPFIGWMQTLPQNYIAVSLRDRRHPEWPPQTSWPVAVAHEHYLGDWAVSADGSTVAYIDMTDQLFVWKLPAR